MQPNVDAELKAAAFAAGLVDIDLVSLIKRDGITIAADGSITGIPEAIAAFKAAKPQYFNVRGLPADAYGKARRSALRNLRNAEGVSAAEELRGLTNDDIRSLDRDAYQRRRNQVSRLLHRARI